MKFDVYGRFELDIAREDDHWIACRLYNGIRRPEPDMIFPADLADTELETFIEDVYHEFARPGKIIQRIA